MNTTLTPIYANRLLMANGEKANELMENPYLARILAQSIDAQALNIEYVQDENGNPTNVIKKIHAPNPCLECEGEVKRLTTDSKSYGGLVAFPSRCEECRAKAYQGHLDSLEIKAHEDATSRCCGHQNRVAIQHGVPVSYDQIEDKKDFQRAFMMYFTEAIDGKDKRGAFLYGPPGTGKTFLSKMMHNELLKKHKHSVFIKAVDLAIVLRKETIGGEYKRVIKEFRNVEYLFIDDYGTQKNTEFVKEAMFTIFDSRYENNRPTIFTSNLRMDDLKKVDIRLASRIKDSEWCRSIPLLSQDLRTQRKIIDVPWDSA